MDREEQGGCVEWVGLGARNLGPDHCSASIEIHELGQINKLELVGSQFALL